MKVTKKIKKAMSIKTYANGNRGNSLDALKRGLIGVIISSHQARL